MSCLMRACARELERARRSSLLAPVLLGLALFAGRGAAANAQGAELPLQATLASCGDCRIPLTMAAAARLTPDSGQAARTQAQARRGSRLPMVFFGAMTAGLVANSFVHADRDPGGYEDSWNTETPFNDKVVHGLAAFALTSVGVDLKVRPVFAALTTCATGAIFEATQGYVSSYDIMADCAGATVAGLWRHWRSSR
jgi:hypothetical protein